LFQILLSPANIVADTLQNPVRESAIEFLVFIFQVGQNPRHLFREEITFEEKRNWYISNQLDAQLNEQFTSFN
jgi:hypothetical protein